MNDHIKPQDWQQSMLMVDSLVQGDAQTLIEQVLLFVHRYGSVTQEPVDPQ